MCGHCSASAATTSHPTMGAYQQPAYVASSCRWHIAKALYVCLPCAASPSELACQLMLWVVSVCLIHAHHCLQLAFQRGMLTEDERDRVFNVMTALGLRLWDDVCTVPVLMKVSFEMLGSSVTLAWCSLLLCSAVLTDLLHSLTVPSPLPFWLHVGMPSCLPSGNAAASPVGGTNWTSVCRDCVTQLCSATACSACLSCAALAMPPS